MTNNPENFVPDHSVDTVAAHALRNLPEPIRRRSFRPGTDKLMRHLGAALEVGLAVGVSNRFDDGADVAEIDVVLYDLHSETAGDPALWPEGENLMERLVMGFEDVEAALVDSRWRTHRARGLLYPASEDVPSDHDSPPSTFVVDFFEEVLSPALDRHNFVSSSTKDADEEGGFLTDRCRMLLWLALERIAEDIRRYVVDPDDGCWTADNLEWMVEDQPREWWDRMSAASSRVADALRRGDPDDLAPQTTAEKVAYALAVMHLSIETAAQDVKDLGLRWMYRRLLVNELDGYWDGILFELVGDSSPETLWHDRAPATHSDASTSHLVAVTGGVAPTMWHLPLVARS